MRKIVSPLISCEVGSDKQKKRKEKAWEGKRALYSFPRRLLKIFRIKQRKKLSVFLHARVGKVHLKNVQGKVYILVEILPCNTSALLHWCYHRNSRSPHENSLCQALAIILSMWRQLIKHTFLKRSQKCIANGHTGKSICALIQDAIISIDVSCCCGYLLRGHPYWVCVCNIGWILPHSV